MATTTDRVPGNAFHRLPSLFGLLFLSAIAAARADVEAPIALEALLAETRVEAPARVPFSELRHSPLFEEPMELRGYVEYLGPGKLSKVIQSPFEEALRIEGGEVSIESGEATRRLPGRSSKAILTLLAPIEAMLAGDEAPLSAAFDYAVDGEASEWHIELKPKARRLAKHVTSVRVSGSRAYVNEIRTDLEGGEQHVMRLHHDEALAE
ncbi:MAG: LolA-related protein [Pseudomonadota bacterium]